MKLFSYMLWSLLMLMLVLAACSKAPNLTLGEPETRFFSSGSPVVFKVPFEGSGSQFNWTQFIGEAKFSSRIENGFAVLDLPAQETTTQLYFRFKLSSGSTTKVYDFYVVNEAQLKESNLLDYSQSQQQDQCNVSAWQDKADKELRIGLPKRLSDTACVQMTTPTEPPAGAYPYEVQRAFWSDGVLKTRWFFLPEGGKIKFPKDNHESLDFPVGTVLVKQFTLNDKAIETRLMIHSSQSSWLGYSYEWNDEQTEAFLLEDSKDKSIDGQLWHYPSSSECLQCHTAGAGYGLGTNLLNMNVISRRNNELHSQLLDLLDLGIFANKVSLQPHLASSENEGIGLNREAREYLEVNCSGCHRPGASAGRAQINLLADTPLAETGTCEVRSWFDSVGILDAYIIAPGRPENSILLKRLSSRESYQMPPLASSIVPENGAELIRRWIGKLDSCE